MPGRYSMKFGVLLKHTITLPDRTFEIHLHTDDPKGYSINEISSQQDNHPPLPIPQIEMLQPISDTFQVDQIPNFDTDSFDNDLFNYSDFSDPFYLEEVATQH